jgi:hypothetical protein
VQYTIPTHDIDAVGSTSSFTPFFSQDIPVPAQATRAKITVSVDLYTTTGRYFISIGAITDSTFNYVSGESGEVGLVNGVSRRVLVGSFVVEVTPPSLEFTLKHNNLESNMAMSNYGSSFTASRVIVEFFT